MPRRRKVEKRITPPDPRFGNVQVQMLINKVMERGKKGTAERIVYRAFEIAGSRVNRDPLEVFEQALRNASPQIEVKPKRVGGATYQVPVEVKADRRITLALRWLIQATRSRSGRPMEERLATELADAFNNTGATIR